MKKLIKKSMFFLVLAGIAGNLSLHGIFENEAQSVADFIFEQVQREGFTYDKHAKDIRSFISLAKLGIVVGGSISAIITFFSMINTIKRITTTNPEENRMVRKLKTFLSCVSSSTFMFTALVAGFLYKVAGSTEANFSGPFAYGKALARLGLKQL